MIWLPGIWLLIPAFLFALYAQMKVKTTYSKYSQISTRGGRTGAEVARYIMRDAGVAGVDVEHTPGQLSDHYDPRQRVLRLSDGVYQGRSIAALGIAAHEVGHAVQHAQKYLPLHLRSVMYPATSFGSTLAWPLFLIGLIFQTGFLLNVGIVLFSVAVLFTIITLPVEFNASSRALKALATGGYLTEEELGGARQVLQAAALTYVAAAAMAVAQLLRMINIARR
jgi:uncharacterized protein